MIESYGSVGDGTCGVFEFRLSNNSKAFLVVASSEGGWDHVSVSLQDRCPIWEEMERIKRMFFGEGETVWQYHVPERQHINCHPYTLHLWRKQDFEMPLPPNYMV